MAKKQTAGRDHLGGLAPNFIGQSYLAPLSTQQVPVLNVTFEPGCRNNWHIHHASSGGGQMLVCVAGRGWYQEWGQEARALHPGDVVNIPAGVPWVLKPRPVSSLPLES